MFDFRYHVTSLAAVFIALVIGLLVGVAISGRSLIRDTERRVLENDIAELQQQLSDAERQVGAAERARGVRARDVPGRHGGPPRRSPRRRRVRRVGRGRGRRGYPGDDRRAPTAVQGMRALQVPIATGDLLRRVADVADGPRTVEDLGRSLARELVDGGETPLWDAVGPALVEEREGGNLPLDAVVVARTAEPQSGQTARFLSGFYSGLAAAGVPVVGVETTDSEPTAVPTYRGHGFSTVDNVDTIPGRVALAVLLTGESPGVVRDEGGQHARRCLRSSPSCRRPGEGAADDPRRRAGRGSDDRRDRGGAASAVPAGGGARRRRRLARPHGRAGRGRRRDRAPAAPARQGAGALVGRARGAAGQAAPLRRRPARRPAPAARRRRGRQRRDLPRARRRRLRAGQGRSRGG